ncbi:MAG: TerB family tellurite resistance protein [Burkholderiales bacterium]|nr:TerB family tellurite resistance protein [Burkholderiales bacterium]
MLNALITKFRDFVDEIAPSPELVAQREASALQRACCSLLMEVARLNSADAERKREVVSLALRQLFSVRDEDLDTMIEMAGRRENRLTSYFKPVALINKCCTFSQKLQFMETLWRVAMADGSIDMYEDQLVRKLADLLAIPHADFILSKHRVQNGG